MIALFQGGQAYKTSTMTMLIKHNMGLKQIHVACSPENLWTTLRMERPFRKAHAVANEVN